MTLNVLAYMIQRLGGAPGSQDLTIETRTTVNAAAASRGSGPNGTLGPAPEADKVAAAPRPCAASPFAWVWAMNDSGANQTTSIVHNGIFENGKLRTWVGVGGSPESVVRGSAPRPVQVFTA